MNLVSSYDLELNCVIEMQLALFSYWLSLCDDVTTLVGLIYMFMVSPWWWTMRKTWYVLESLSLFPIVISYG